MIPPSSSASTPLNWAVETSDSGDVQEPLFRNFSHPTSPVIESLADQLKIPKILPYRALEALKNQFFETVQGQLTLLYCGEKESDDLPTEEQLVQADTYCRQCLEEFQSRYNEKAKASHVRPLSIDIDSQLQIAKDAAKAAAKAARLTRQGIIEQEKALDFFKQATSSDKDVHSKLDALTDLYEYLEVHSSLCSNESVKKAYEELAKLPFFTDFVFDVTNPEHQVLKVRLESILEALGKQLDCDPISIYIEMETPSDADFALLLQTSEVEEYSLYNGSLL